MLRPATAAPLVAATPNSRQACAARPLSSMQSNESHKNESLDMPGQASDNASIAIEQHLLGLVELVDCTLLTVTSPKEDPK